MQNLRRLMLVCALVLRAPAQETTGTITGTVRDPSSAIVPGAEVTIRNSGTGAQRRVRTGPEGQYVATSLPVGTYEVEVTHQGFKKAVAQSIQLSVDNRLVVDIALQVGAVTELTTVETRISQLETETATVSGLVDSKRVVDLPLNGRNFAQLINLQAGVSTNNNSNQGSGQFVNGSRGAYNNFLLDGGDLNDPVVPNGSAAGVTGAFTGSAPGINAVSVDAVEEFRVITSGAIAEFGRNSGGQINVITKSGTNQLHGSLFHFLRNRELDARSFFDLNPAFQRDGKAIAPPFTQNNFGGTLGGPIRKDKLFYFASYEGFRQRQGVSVVNNIPSPNTIAAIKRQSPALGQIFESVFSGPFSLAVPNDRTVEQIIAANTPVLGAKSLVRSNSFDQDALMGKIDYHASANSRLSGRYAYFNNDAGPGTVAGSGLPATGVGFSNKVHNLVLAHTLTLSSTRLNELRAAFQRNGVDNSFDPAPQPLLDSGKLRTGPLAGQAYGDPFTPNGIPTVNAGFGLPELGYTVTSPNVRFSNTYHVSDSFAWIRGRMTMKFGAEIRRIQDNSTFSFLVRPNPQYASGGANTILQPGAPINFFTQNLFLTPATSLRGFRITEWAPFAQTTIRVTRNLTIEAGLRYEYLGRASEVNGFLSNAFLAPGGKPALGASVISNGIAALNQIRLITVGRGRDQGLFQADKNNWASRAGAAWSMGLTTLRASYGIFYDRIFD
ncbi:MAG: carboxypeptidase regulatory-like domain-containing protein, partial [Acidobacteria bacterium]|nr:carboxypeptidase regulatory-like domain-containing protein [Acidobacteriota bacterium]